MLGAAALLPQMTAARADGDHGAGHRPPILVALTNVATTALAVSAKVTEGLLEYDEGLNPQPLLATAWEVSPDGLSYTFKLREGVKWHDGKPFTSEDMAFSISLLQKVHPRGKQTFANVSSIETPDPLTVVLKLSKPAPYLIKAFAPAETPIVAKHIYEGTDPASNPNGNTRCPVVQEVCASKVPALRTLANGQQVACHFA